MPRLPDADPLLTLAIVLIAGVTFGRLAKLARLPSITGQIIIGVLLGESVLHLFDGGSVDGLRPVTHFALGLMAVTVGAHLNLKRLRNAGKRLFLLLLTEATITPIVVTLAVVALPGVELSFAALIGAIAVSTAPATIVALVSETRSKGVFVKTLIAAVALNNMACIVLFELARVFAHAGLEGGGELSLLQSLAAPASQLMQAVLLGGGAAVCMHWVSHFVVRPDLLSTAGILAILTTSGLADYLGISPLLSCLFLGIVQTNMTPVREKLVDTPFENFQPAILAVFFTLAGMNLHFDQIQTAGVVAAVTFLARSASKVLSVRLAMGLAGATEKVRRYLGLALLPQAGLAIGLVILIQNDPVFQREGELLNLFLAVVLTVVTLNEIVGPVLTRYALTRSGEAGMDRTRLIDFVREENIVVGFDAPDKETAIERLVDHMIRSHHLNVDRDTLLTTVLDRESQASTCLGGGLAIPHGILPGDHAMVGVIGISRDGLGFSTPDQRPVHCMVLLGTSKGERNRHLQVLAALASKVGQDAAFQDRLFNATSAAHADEILHGAESEDFNYFLED